MKKTGIVYNIIKSDNRIKINSFKDGVPKVSGRQFTNLSDALYWITEVNMAAHCALDVQINIKLK